MPARDGSALGSRHPRYRLFLVAFPAASLLLIPLLPIIEAVLVGFDVAVAVFVLSCINLWRDGRPEVIRRQAFRDDAGQFLLLLLTVLISTVILSALGLLILDKKALDGGHIAILIATLLSSWTYGNLVYAFHYARLYYSPKAGGDHGGLAFPGDCEPDFSDFVNFAFVIGMTCQTADISITDSAMRRVSTFHGLFAFAFNLGILALTVNVLASS
ncbi:putative membrane protein [Novosphingobium fluoreni]|uniref:Putative membrane protein n=1 Tax=Novosphingobium fluoreni TaxID=1391222 RepID=A0A7W6C339_9SPHN|nr:DUF1345 domain-containing protein [Novosphingobium fluoreni]MBB3939580.1 putative membrane protein [Novosphingobium fluoreni]